MYLWVCFEIGWKRPLENCSPSVNGFLQMWLAAPRSQPLFPLCTGRTEMVASQRIWAGLSAIAMLVILSGTNKRNFFKGLRPQAFYVDVSGFRNPQKDRALQRIFYAKVLEPIKMFMSQHLGLDLKCFVFW